MAKIKITQKQYDAIILNEQKRILTESNDKPDYSNDNNVILAFSKLMGITLTGMNKIDAENALKQESTLNNCCTLCNVCNIEANFNRDSWKLFYTSLLKERYGYNYLQKEVKDE